ncbi:MAG: glycosyltransferase family 9 protein [Ilyomonas sp.]
MKLNPDKIQKIAIFRALQLGDMLCVIPAIRALRAAYPDAEITLLGLPWAAGFVKRFSKYFDRFIHFPGYPNLPEQEYDAKAFAQFLQQVQEEHFDLVLQMQGNGTYVNPLVHQFGAVYTAGFYNNKSYIESDLFIPYPNYGSEIERHLLLMSHLGIPLDGTYLEFPITEKDEKDFNELLLPLIPGKYVCTHPGSRSAARQWPPQYFAALADYCIERGYTVVITGTKDEVDITREVAKCMNHPAIDLSGKTSLGAVAVLIKNAFLLISNCTGVSHIASAVKTKSVVISLDGEPERWGPLNRQLHHVIDWTTNPHFDAVLLEVVSVFNQPEYVKVER